MVSSCSAGLVRHSYRCRHAFLGAQVPGTTKEVTNRLSSPGSRSVTEGNVDLGTERSGSGKWKKKGVGRARWHTKSLAKSLEETQIVFKSHSRWSFL